jgi:hypothetical protein
MGAGATGLGRAHDWPCVGDPEAGVIFACGARGDISLLAPVAGSQVMDIEDDSPVLVHLTVCRQHVRAARAWLAARTAEDIDTYSTEMLMREWGQVREVMEDTPIYSMVQAV